MNKLTKVLSIFVLAGVIGTGVAGVAGCNNKKPNSGKHDHSYTYTDNKDGTHNGNCECGKDAIENEQHVDANKDNVCDMEGCGASLVVEQPITDPKVTSVTISGAQTVEVDGKITLTVNVVVEGGAAQTVTWSSSDENKATVSATGEVTGVAEGTVTITATSTVDDTKKDTYEITVTAKSTQPGPDTQTVYEKLVAQSNKLYNNDFSEAGTVGVHGGYGAAFGIYTDTESAVVIADGAVKHKEGVKGPDGTTGINTNIIVDFGPISSGGVIEGYMEVGVSDIGSSWNLIQFKNASGDTVFAVGADKDKNLSYIVGSSLTEKDASNNTVNAEGTTAIDLAFSEKTVYKVYYKFDLSTGSVKMDINGKEISVESSEINSLVGIILPSGNKGARLVTLDNVVFCGTPMAADDYRPIALANLDKEYAKYILEDGETEDGTPITATHSINKTAVENAYAVGKQAIEDATTFEAIQEAYADVIETLEFILSDEEVKEMRLAAIAEVDEAYPADDYTFENLTGDDAIYNNKEAYLAVYTEIVGRINTFADQMTVNMYLGEVLELGELSEILTDEDALEAKTDAVNEELETYREEDIAALEETHASLYAEIQAIINAGVNTAECDTIPEINAAYEAVKNRINQRIGSASETAEQAQPTAEAAIDAAATAAKVGIDEDSDIIGNIDDLVTEAKADIQSVVTANGTAAKVYAISDLAVAKIDALKDVWDAMTEALPKVALNSDAEADIYQVGFDISEITVDTENAVDAVEAAKDAALQAIDEIVEQYTGEEATYEVTIRVSDNSPVGDKIIIGYGDVIKSSDIKVLAKQVLSAKINNVDIPEDGIALGQDTDVFVTLGDIEGYEGVIDWRPTVGAAASAELEKNNLFTVDDTGYKAAKAITKTIGTKTFASSVYTDGIATNNDNSEKPITITLNEDLNELVVYLTLDDGSATNNRAGTIYCVIDDGDPIEIKSVLNATNNKTDMSIAYSVPETALKTGTVLKFYGKNVNSSNATFHLFGVDAAIDGGQVEKEVSITWGSAAEATLYHYYDKVELPEDPVDPDGKTFIGWYYTPAGGTETKYEGGEKFPSGTTIAMTPKFLSDNITLKFKLTADQETPVEKKFARQAGVKVGTVEFTADEAAYANPAKENNYFIGWQTSDGTLIDLAEITPNEDITVMKTIELTPKFAVHETVTSEENVADVKKADFEAISQTSPAAVTATTTWDGWLSVVTLGSTSWKTGTSEYGLQTKNSVFKVVTDKAVTLTIVYYSTNNARKLKIEKMVTDEDGNVVKEDGVAKVEATTLAEETANDWAKTNTKDKAGKDLKAKDITLAAGTYYITFDNNGDHKVNSIAISSTSKQEITGVLQKITAETVEGATVVKAVMLYNNVEYTVTLTADQYTVVDGKIIYGTGKTAADAHQYNSCPVPTAE